MKSISMQALWARVQRIRSGLTQKELAKKIGVSLYRISRIERGVMNKEMTDREYYAYESLSRSRNIPARGRLGTGTNDSSIASTIPSRK